MWRGEQANTAGETLADPLSPQRRPRMPPFNCVSIPGLRVPLPWRQSAPTLLDALSQLNFRLHEGNSHPSSQKIHWDPTLTLSCDRALAVSLADGADPERGPPGRCTYGANCCVGASPPARPRGAAARSGSGRPADGPRLRLPQFAQRRVAQPAVRPRAAGRWPGGAPGSAPSTARVSHRRTVKSPEPDASVAPSGLKASDQI